MAVLDIIILIVIALSAVIGLIRGLVKEIVSLAGWVLAFVVALLFSAEVAQMLPAGWGALSLRTAIAFVLLFVVALIAAAIVQWIIAQLVQSTGLTGTDRFLGFLFGSARGVLVVLVILMGLRGIAGEADWYQQAQIPPELLAFEDEVRALLGEARSLVPEGAIPIEGI